MTYVVYDKDSTVVLSYHATLRGAKISAAAANRREVKYAATHSKYSNTKPNEYDVASYEHHRTEIVHMIEITNMMTGLVVKIPSDTPYSCRVDRESYWSA